MPTDTERLDWLEANLSGGALIEDDCGNFAVSTSGTQNIPEYAMPDGPPLSEGDPGDIVLSRGDWIERQQLKGTIREAIDFAMDMDRSDG